MKKTLLALTPAAITLAAPQVGHNETLPSQEQASRLRHRLRSNSGKALWKAKLVAKNMDRVAGR